MRVVVVGAGALGSVYGARLACMSGCQVNVVARAPAAARVRRLECVHDGSSLDWAVPARLERAPADAQVILVFVRYEYLDAVVDRVAGSAAVVVLMTPLMPQDFARLSAAMPGRLAVGMPSIVAYENAAHAVRYWLPHGSTTLVEVAEPDTRPELTELVAKLQFAGVAAKREPNVLARSAATTMSILPLAMAVDIAGGLDAALADDALLALAREAAEEGRKLGATFGQPEPWASLVPRFAGPRMLRAAAALTRSHFPETITYIDHHFKSKLHAQNLLLCSRVLELARQRRTRCEAFARLLGRLERRS
jgi:ketopantoate reductase